MSHFIMVPTNESGVIADGRLPSYLGELAKSPFSFSDVFIYSHGWWTNADAAMADYNRFTVEFARVCLRLAAQSPVPPGLPGNSLGIGVNWPSTLTEDNLGLLNFLEAASFYTMEKRADVVGQNGLYTLLRTFFQAWPPGPNKLRLHFLGHSFGTKVVCSALQELVDSYQKKEVNIPNNVSLNVVLLQAAFDNNDMEIGNVYGSIAQGYPNLRMLVTISRLDLALRNLYPAAQIVQFFRGAGARQALGAVGPTLATGTNFGGMHQIVVSPGFASFALPAPSQRLVVADITPVHAAHATFDGGLSGHHSDIFLPEIYHLILNFIQNGYAPGVYLANAVGPSGPKKGD